MVMRIRVVIGAVVLALVLVAVGGAAEAQPTQLPPPPSGLIQTWIASFHLNGHVFRPGQKIVATVKVAVPHCFVPKAQCVQTADWQLGGLPTGRGCKNFVPPGTPTVTCTVVAGAPTNGWVETQANFQNPTGTPAYSQDYFAIVGKSDAVIDGTITDKDGGPAAGVTVRAYGNGSGVTTVSGPNGFYELNVDPGSYRVVPSGGPQGKARVSFRPASDTVSVHAGRTATSNFLLEGGLELQLDFGKTTVAADGSQVVTGMIKTSEFGKPKGGVSVQLTAMPDGTYDEAVTTAPRAAICSGATRVWPLGAINAASGAPVNITTDPNGEYAFSITVGTTPGPWTLDAWARSADGGLSTDVSAASDKKSVTFTSLGATKLDEFVTEVNRLKDQPELQGFSTDPATMVSIFSKIAAQGATKGFNLGGLAFAETAASDGTMLLIFPADRPPLVNSAGQIVATGASAGDLVLDPNEWTAKGLSQALATAGLQAVITSGELPDLPTFAQWSSGAHVKGWDLKAKNTMTIGSQNLQQFGWTYATPSTSPGACY